MKTNYKISHVSFDIFGTLIKFGAQHHPFRQLLKWARENGRQVRPDDARTVMTINGGVDAISHGLGINPPRELVQKVEAQIEDELSSLTLFDDVIPTLNALQSRGIRIGICSNLAQPYGAVISKLLADFDLKQFLSYELGAIKPEAQIYESILDCFNCEPEQCLFIGDTFEADYAGPIAVGMGVDVRRTTTIMTTYKVLEQYQDDLAIETLSIRFNLPAEKIQKWVDVARAIANLKTKAGGLRMINEKTERKFGDMLLPAKLADHEEEKYLEETVRNLRGRVKNDKGALKDIRLALQYYLSHSLITNTGIGFTERTAFRCFVDCFIPVIKPEYWRVISGVGTKNSILTDKHYASIREAEDIFKPCALHLRHPKEASLIAKDNGFEKYTSQILRFFMHMTAIRMLSVDEVNQAYSTLSESVSDT